MSSGDVEVNKGTEEAEAREPEGEPEQRRAWWLATRPRRLPRQRKLWAALAL